MNIVLIGYRGSGKSAVGRILAERLERKLVSTDERIVERAGRRIPEIVESGGWEAFRDIETQVISEIAKQEELIIDAGGGVVVRKQNVDMLRSNGKLFWLTAKVLTLAYRIQGDTERPSLTGNKSFVEEIEEVLKGREPLYREAAHHVIDTERKTPEQVAQDIMDRL